MESVSEFEIRKLSNGFGGVVGEWVVVWSLISAREDLVGSLLSLSSVKNISPFSVVSHLFILTLSPPPLVWNYSSH